MVVNHLLLSWEPQKSPAGWPKLLHRGQQFRFSLREFASAATSSYDCEARAFRHMGRKCGATW